MVKVEGRSLLSWSEQAGVELAAIAIVSCRPLRDSAGHTGNRLLVDSSLLI